MANRNFKPGAMTLENETRKIYAKCLVGTAGSVSAIEGTGISTITAEAGASGQYSITLEDSYNKFLHGNVALVAAAQGTAKTALTGASEAATFTFVQKSSCTAGDFAIVTDSAGVKWAFSIDTTGTDPTPTSALYTAIPAAKKIHVDISGASTNAQVAAAVRAAFAGLSGIGTTTTVGAASNETFPVTQVLRASVADAAVYKADGTASPTSVSVVTGTQGVQTAVNVTDNTVAFVGHGLYTGRAVALTINSGTLPAGLSATTYYVIVVDADTIKFATSLANAEAGTAVDITDYGDASKTMTITPSAVLGSQVTRVEFLDTALANVATGGKLYFNCYNGSSAGVQVANGTTMLIELTLRNSNVKSKGES